jgi:hypothetical protein
MDWPNPCLHPFVEGSAARLLCIQQTIIRLSNHPSQHVHSILHNIEKAATTTNPSAQQQIHQHNNHNQSIVSIINTQ